MSGRFIDVMAAAERRDSRPRSSLPARSDTSDADLCVACRNGDSEALAELYVRYGDAVMAIAFRLLGSVPDAEDVLHDVFMGLPEALRHYEDRGTLGAWLRRIAARVALTRLRQDRARNQIALDDATLTQRASNRDDALSLESAVAALPPGLRAVLVLKEIERFTHAEIAGMLGISSGASEVRLHRALRLLRRALSEGERS